MTAKPVSIWMCADCGLEQTNWSGRCPGCGAWNTLREVRAPRPQGRGATTVAEPIKLQSIAQGRMPLKATRLATGLGEVDRVLGGGFFPGSVVLLAGEPGVGKSTLLLQLAERLSRTLPVVYLSGEESAAQIADRASRLQLADAPIELASATDLAAMLDLISVRRPGLMILDSIQTVADSALPSPAGSLLQVRAAALALQEVAKRLGTTLLLVGHVTKDGVAAGPRTLEHMVDVVLYLEGEATGQLRLLRGTKNRYGPTDEVGIFEMGPAGLTEVANPSARFLSARDRTSPGTAATVVLEGKRPILVEIQALVRPAGQPYPRRTAAGVESARLELILAVLETRAGLKVGQFDCFLSVSGGLRIREPAADLAVALAVASARSARPLPKNLIAFGEVGLTGEIRPVPAVGRRLEEARRLGFDRAVAATTLAAACDELDLIPAPRRDRR